METPGKSTGVERRRYKRVNVSANVLQGSEFMALDLSEGGMKLEALKPYRVSQSISLRLNLNGESLEVQAKIVRCQQSSSVFNPNYLMGVKFVNIKTSEILKIRGYLEPYREDLASAATA